MNIQTVFQCWFIIRSGCSRSLLKTGLVMKVRGLFLDLVVVTGKPGRFLGWVCEGKGQRVVWGLSFLFEGRWSYSSPQHSCCSGVVGRVGMVTEGRAHSPLEMTQTKSLLRRPNPMPSSPMSLPRTEVLDVAHAPYSSCDKSDFVCTTGKPWTGWFKLYLEM